MKLEEQVLLRPPAALCHHSWLSHANLLYGGGSKVAGDVAYRGGSPDPSDYGGGSLVGVMMFQATMSLAVPCALLYNGDELTLVIPDAPLGAMEAELSMQASVSGFECYWMGVHWKQCKALRVQVLEMLGELGKDRTPHFFESGLFWMERRGPLGLLRLRQPVDGQEKLEAMEMVAALQHRADDNWLLDGREVLRQHEGALKVRSLFVREEAAKLRLHSATAKILAREVPQVYEDFASFALAPAIACLVMQNVVEEEWYGNRELQQVPMELSADWAPVSERIDAMEEEIEKATPSTPTDGLVPLRWTLSQIVANIGMPVTLHRVLGHASIPGEVLRRLGQEVFADEDAELVEKAGFGLGEETLSGQLRKLGLHLDKRFALLTIWSELQDGGVQNAYLDSATHSGRDGPMVEGSGGRWSLRADEVNRFIRFPWVLPLIIDGDAVIFPEVRGVHRECLALNSWSRRLLRSKMETLPAVRSEALDALERGASVLETLSI